MLDVSFLYLRGLNRQGRPLNVSHEAACFIGKRWEVEKGAHGLKLGG